MRRRRYRCIIVRGATPVRNWPVSSSRSSVAPILFPMWLVAHRELHNSRRVRVVYDVIAGELAGR